MKQAAGSTGFCTTLGPALAPCDAVFAALPSSGSVGPGGTCSSYDDCASPSGAVAVCTPLASSPTSGTGACRQVLRGLAGDAPCSNEQYDGITASESTGTVPNVSYSCHDFDGMYCDFATSTCEPFQAVGQPCDLNGDDCGPYESCQFAGYGADGGIVQQCTADLEADAACDPTANNVYDVQCDPRTTRCRAATNTCTPFLPSGSPCTTDDECESACTAGKCASAIEAQLCDSTQPSFNPQSRPIRPLARSFGPSRR